VIETTCENLRKSADYCCRDKKCLPVIETTCENLRKSADYCCGDKKSLRVIESKLEDPLTAEAGHSPVKEMEQFQIYNTGLRSRWCSMPQNPPCPPLEKGGVVWALESCSPLKVLKKGLLVGKEP